MKRLFFLIPLLIFLALTVGLGFGLHHSQTNEGASHFAQHVGDKVPDKVIGDYDPKAMQGHAYIINFFASWCVPCHAEHDQLRNLMAQGIPVIGVAYRDKPQAIQKFLLESGNPFKIMVMDSDGAGGIEWGITGVPETFIIDKTGIIRAHFAEPLSEDMVADKLMPLWEQVKE